MAWRIHRSVQRGEIDDRERNSVRGRIWMHGIPEPLIVELTGNACPDLAGCLLAFENQRQTAPPRRREKLELLQRGAAGDMSASIKTRVLEVSHEEALR